MNLLKALNIKKSLIFEKTNFYLLVVISLIFYFDRYSKIQIINKYNDQSIFINKFINFDLIWNTGIGFGLLSTNSSLIYNSITILISLIVVVLLYVALISSTIEKIIFAAIIGGALGNLYDRIFYYAVPDFIDLHYGHFHWFVFNLADIFISIGIIAFIVKDFLIKKT